MLNRACKQTCLTQRLKSKFLNLDPLNCTVTFVLARSAAVISSKLSRHPRFQIMGS